MLSHDRSITFYIFGKEGLSSPDEPKMQNKIDNAEVHFSTYRHSKRRFLHLRSILAVFDYFDYVVY